MIITNSLLQQLINEEFEKALAKRRLTEAPGNAGEKGEKAALAKLKPLMKLTTTDKYGYIVPKGNTSKTAVLLKISTYGRRGDGTEPAHLEIASYGGGVNGHRETPGNQAYRAALGALWDLVYPEEPERDDDSWGTKLNVSDAVKIWPTVEELLCTANEEKAELDKVKMLPKETAKQKAYMDRSWKNETSFVNAAAEYLLMKDMGQEPWDVPRDEFIMDYGEDQYFEDLKSYAVDAQDAIIELLDNDEPATMRNLEKHLKKGKSKPKPKRRG